MTKKEFLRNVLTVNHVAYEVKEYLNDYGGEISEDMANKIKNSIDMLDEIRSEIVEYIDK